MVQRGATLTLSTLRVGPLPLPRCGRGAVRMTDRDRLELLAMRGIVKRFAGVAACDAVDLTLFAGDVLGLLGENGAGETTLMNVLFGTYAADAGSITVDGQPVHIRHSADALKLGIGMVHQHFHLVPRHSVLENLMVGRRGRGLAGRANDATVSEALLAELMCGHAIAPARRPPQAPGRPLLRLAGISTTGSERRRLKDLSLEVRAGEIVGVAGIAGNGQRELADVIAGMLTPIAGTVEIDGRTVARLDPRRAQALGIGRVPEDRIAT